MVIDLIPITDDQRKKVHELLDEAKGVIKNGNNTAKREFWHIQSIGR